MLFDWQSILDGLRSASTAVPEGLGERVQRATCRRGKRSPWAAAGQIAGVFIPRPMPSLQSGLAESGSRLQCSGLCEPIDLVSALRLAVQENRLSRWFLALGSPSATLSRAGSQCVSDAHHVVGRTPRTCCPAKCRFVVDSCGILLVCGRVLWFCICV